MNTDTLIASLANEARPVSAHTVERRLAIGLTAGAIVAFALVIAVLGFRYDLAAAIHGTTIWMKWAYTLTLTVIAVAATRQLARPDAIRNRTLWFAAVPFLLLGGLAAIELARTPRAGWMALWMGRSARECPVLLAALSVPVFLGLLWSFRRLAPTRLRLTGAAAGLAAGGAAATCYGFACPETSALFVVTWYTLGIVIAALLGAIAGPRLLRW